MAIVLIALVLVGPLSLLFGETRYDERDRRSWWPGAPHH